MHVPVCQRIDPSSPSSSLRRAGDDEGLGAEAGRAAEIAVDGVGRAMRARAENVALQAWKQNTSSIATYKYGRNEHTHGHQQNFSWGAIKILLGRS